MLIRRCAGLAALAFVAGAALSPAVGSAAAGDDCGPAAPAPGNVTVAAGAIACVDAMAVVSRYQSDFAVAGDEWVRFDGWDCWTPTTEQAVLNGFTTECSRGMDNIQIRG